MRVMCMRVHFVDIHSLYIYIRVHEHSKYTVESVVNDKGDPSNALVKCFKLILKRRLESDSLSNTNILQLPLLLSSSLSIQLHLATTLLYYDFFYCFVLCCNFCYIMMVSDAVAITYSYPSIKVF